MAEEQARDSRFDYKTNSNLVLRCDNTLVDKRDRNEATGEVHSLVNTINTMRMGDRVQIKSSHRSCFLGRHETKTRQSNVLL